jgi:hypothetical protein
MQCVPPHIVNFVSDFFNGSAFPILQRPHIPSPTLVRMPRLKHVVFESYDELDRYLVAVESRAADACTGFQRNLRDTGGHPMIYITPYLQYLKIESKSSIYTAQITTIS